MPGSIRSGNVRHPLLQVLPDHNSGCETSVSGQLNVNLYSRQPPGGVSGTCVSQTQEAVPRLELEPGSPWLAYAYIGTGRRSEAERLAAESAAFPYRLAVIFAALGDPRRAIDALERAALTEPHRMGRLLIEPEVAALRGDPRVAAIRRRFNLP